MNQCPMPSKPDIQYPCKWEYKVIGSDSDKLRKAIDQVVETVMGQLTHQYDYRVTPSNESKGGKYISLAVELTVPDEAFRLRLFEALCEHQDIRMVL